jgi:hypothetical protein
MLFKFSILTLTGPFERPTSTTHHKDNSVLIAATVGVIVPVAIIVAASIFIWIAFRRRRARMTNSMALASIQSNAPIIQDVLVLERLGGGAFGDVYRGLINVSRYSFNYIVRFNSICLSAI